MLSRERLHALAVKSKDSSDTDTPVDLIDWSGAECTTRTHATPVLSASSAAARLLQEDFLQGGHGGRGGHDVMAECEVLVSRHFVYLVLPLTPERKGKGDGEVAPCSVHVPVPEPKPVSASAPVPAPSPGPSVALQEVLACVHSEWVRASFLATAAEIAVSGLKTHPLSETGAGAGSVFAEYRLMPVTAKLRVAVLVVSMFLLLFLFLFISLFLAVSLFLTVSLSLSLFQLTYWIPVPCN